jgi:hypothetical protein
MIDRAEFPVHRNRTFKGSLLLTIFMAAFLYLFPLFVFGHAGQHSSAGKGSSASQISGLPLQQSSTRNDSSSRVRRDPPRS